jgi:carbamoyltransferase
MLVLGITGGYHRIQEDSYSLPTDAAHDAAAVLLEDGRVVAAIEEERLSRIKHSNKAPFTAIRFCLEQRGVSLEDVDRVAYYCDEKYMDHRVRRSQVDTPEGARGLLRMLLWSEFGHDVGAERIRFVGHHRAHAASAYFMSGFDSALVVTLDGSGDDLCSTFWQGEGNALHLLREVPTKGRSLGLFYESVIRFLGYRLFDEYKVMGLAPYGDPARFREQVSRMYSLRPEGEWAFHFDKVDALHEVMKPRRRGEPFTQEHKDLAAALQQGLEEVAFHILGHYQKMSGQTRLCLAGGVAHNSTMNGKVLHSGLFERVFVQPAAHDAGCALGAAITAWHDARPEGRAEPLRHVYWGSDIGTDAHLRQTLQRWSPFVTAKRVDDVCQAAAELLAGGKVLGWAQGRSEFGPRALGNRSIIADPRPEENKTVINAMVKKREGYRPFAPAILEEEAQAYFDIPEGVTLPFMTTVVGVKEDKRALLGATTHVDGSARVQTVSRETNPRFWDLLQKFKALTGVPVLLNTSFNNNAEPIVDSAEDAVVCFLTTKLQGLVVGDYVVEKRDITEDTWLATAPAVPAYLKLVQVRRTGLDGSPESRCSLNTTYEASKSFKVSPVLFDVLMRADGKTPLRELLQPQAGADVAAVIEELLHLWSERLVILHPS